MVVRTSKRAAVSSLARRVSLVVLALTASWTAASAQELADLVPGEALYEFRLVDGSVVIARVAEVDGEQFVLITSGGARLEVTAAQIQEVSPATGRVVEGEYWNEDPNHTRLYFMNTGRSLRQGQAYLGTYAIVFPFVAVGLTDRISVAAGAPILIGEIEPFYVAPKVQLIRTDNVAISAGALTLIYDGDVFGVAFGTGTFGTTDRAFHVGLGFGFSGEDFSNEPVAMIGADVRLSRRGKFITENYILPGETGGALSAGFRFIGERLTSDIGVAGLIEESGGSCCLPLVNFSYSFGRR